MDTNKINDFQESSFFFFCGKKINVFIDLRLGLKYFILQDQHAHD